LHLSFVQGSNNLIFTQKEVDDYIDSVGIDNHEVIKKRILEVEAD